MKNNKSSFFQIVYAVNGKRTTHSTKKNNKKEACKYLEEFKITLENPLSAVNSTTQITDNTNNPTLSIFKEEYFGYEKPINSKKYIYSISLSFNLFIFFCGDVLLDSNNTRTVDKFINSTFTRTWRGAHHY
ncbi:MAG: hypothetical protein NTX22_11330 [Ignavibacteriales bacterium]|nr:hypothetical protein [Ignavibacteriales bacterium]